MKQVYASFDKLLPGENRFWETQRQWIDQGFSIMEHWAKVWK